MQKWHLLGLVDISSLIDVEVNWFLARYLVHVTVSPQVAETST